MEHQPKQRTWSSPAYSRSAVNRAARTYMDSNATDVDRDVALLIMNNWRSSHRFPLNTLQMNLRRRAREVDPDALVAQRIKRLPSIRQKLELRPRMEFARMQDLGGCRAVVTDVEAVETLVDSILNGRHKHQMVRHDDYIEGPRDSGYRGHHLVYKYVGKDTHRWDDLSIEIQIRSRLQHAWATTVETVSMFTQQSLKSSVGEPDWLRFFALMSSEIALREGCGVVPGTPEDVTMLRLELAALATQLDVLTRLTAFNRTLETIEQNLSGAEHRYYLLELTFLEDGTATLRTQGARRLAEAQDLYELAERASERHRDRDVVLVTVESFEQLRRAYPNYYADTYTFRHLLGEALGHAQEAWMESPASEWPPVGRNSRPPE